MNITSELLLDAYRQGIFPMADGRDAQEIHWYRPRVRALIPLDERFHIPQSLQKFLRKTPLRYTVDQAFAEVIAACASPRPGEPDSWINPLIQSLYTDLHRQGVAHSLECWQDGALVGGLYGLHLGGAFFGESMFSRTPNASKAALVQLVTRLRQQGFQLLDSQYYNPHLVQFGLFEIPDKQYQRLLDKALQTECVF